MAYLPAATAILDGEIISAEKDGRPNFGALQDDLKRRRYDRMVITRSTCCISTASTRAFLSPHKCTTAPLPFLLMAFANH